MLTSFSNFLVCRHYVFYKGAWKFWADNELDIENMTIREYNKELVLATLGLDTVEKAQLFVALAGGLKSSEINRKKIFQFFWSSDHRFENIAEFVNSQPFPITKQGLAKIVAGIFGPDQYFQSICEDFRMTLSLMNPKFPDNPYFSDPGCSQNDLLNYKEYILANDPIYISPIFMDARYVLITKSFKFISQRLFP